MAYIRIPFLVAKPNKAGLVRWFWQPSAALARAGWASLPLGEGGTVDAPPAAIADAARARNREVEAWRKAAAEGAAPAPVPVARPLTLADLVDRYRRDGYPSVKAPGKAVAAATAGEYEQKFKAILFWAGDVPLAAITPERVERFKEALLAPAAAGRWKGQVRYTSAHAHLRVGRTLFSFAEQKRLIPKGTNPFDEFALAPPDPREQIWWPPAREALLETAAGDPGMEVAITLAYSIGQREADLLRTAISQYAEIPSYKMDPDVWETLSRVEVPAYGGRPAYAPGDVKGIRLRQSKGKRWIEVPIVGAERARVEAAVARAKAAGVTTLLFDDRRPPENHPAAEGWRPRPWTVPNAKAGQRRFIKRFAALRQATIERLAKAGAAGDEIAAELAREIGELQYRDFRRTAVVAQGELGIADHLIAAITAHSLDDTKKILDTYMPRTTGMAARAIALSHARAPVTGAREERR